MTVRGTDGLGAFPLWFPAIVLVLWFVVLRALSMVSGWAMLSRRFRTASPSPAGSRHSVSGRLGWVGFRSSLTVGHSASGLYLSVFFVFRPFYPPLLIPWGSIRRRSPRKESSFSTYDSLEIQGNGGDVELRLYGNVAGEFEHFLPRPPA
jgi:hypothetical protein